MINRTGIVLALALLAEIFPMAILQARAQESAQKSAAEQNPTPKNAADKSAKEPSSGEKNKTDNNLADNPINFPQLQAPVELRPARGTRITLKLADSSRVIYETIGRQAKISVLFDPDYIPRNISVDLNGVSLQDALKIVAFESRTFWRPVTSDAIFVAQDTQAKRYEFEQQILKTFYFPNIFSPTDLQDIVNGMRTLIEVQRVQQMPSHQTIMVRGTPEQMALAERVVDDLNRAKQKTGGEYRLEYKINETSADQKVISRTYTLLVEPHEIGKLRVGPRIPIQTSDKERTYLDVGKNIDCRVRFETEHTVSLHLTVEFSDAGTDEHGVADRTAGNPVIQQVRMETSVTLELGTPTIVSSFQDPVSKHSFQIEATAIRTKSKE
jgi:hypothetical protein